MTTTTASASKVLCFLEELLQTRWNDLRVHVTSVTDQWAGVAVAGPLSRQVLGKLFRNDSLFTNEEFPFMAVKQYALEDTIQCRIARISFSGERAYEIYMPSDYSLSIMKDLWEIARPMGGCLYGLEALGALRIEKGHLTHAEIDGRTTLNDLGMQHMMSKKKSCIGSSLSARPALKDSTRAQLVGIFPVDKREIFNAGSIIFCKNNLSGHGNGWITSVTYSVALGHWIGLGFIEGGYNKWSDQTLICSDPIRKGNTPIRVVHPQMYDSHGTKLND
tara:strand:- start:56 stop:883 length:828 start_codon:yes stop_codon:yes gene_type:complete